MSTDRELLEAAAKAADINIVFHGDCPFDEAGDAWHPLTDDGDALRLAVKLAIEIRPGFGMITAAGAGVWEDVPTTEYGRETATRRAIVRAAAAMAKDTA